MLLLLCLAVAFQLQLVLLYAANPLIITTIAGGGAITGDGISATTVSLSSPTQVALDASGNIYIADSEHHRIRKVDAVTKLITTVAGTGTAGYSGDDVIATKAKLWSPSGVILDGLGNIYISDCGNDRIRRVDAVTKIITTIAGTPTGKMADGILATSASLSCPSSLVFDAAGNFFFSDVINSRIRRIDAVTKIITTVAGSIEAGNYGDGVAADTAKLNLPLGLSLDASGNMYIADTNNNLIRRVDVKTNIITTIAGTGKDGFNGDNIRATKAQFNLPSGITIDAKGNIFIADRFNNIVRRIDPVTLNVTTYAGTVKTPGTTDDVAATSAKLFGPTSVTVDAGGNMFIADYDANRVRYIDARTFAPTPAPTSAPTLQTTLAPSNSVSPVSTPKDVAIVNPLIITTIAGGGKVFRDGVLATASNLSNPTYAAFDAFGNIYIADSEHHRVRKVDALTKIISTIAGTGTAGYSGDNVIATKSLLSSPAGVILDGSGNIYISDCGNDRIRRVDAVTKIITTVAGTINGKRADGILATTAYLSCPSSLVFDAAGNFFFADVINSRIRRIDAVTKIITTVAGTGALGSSGNGVDATEAELNYPHGVSLDASGNIYIADTNNNLIRRVDVKTNIITTIGGTGTGGFNGDNIRATKAQFNYPSGITIDAKGNIFIADRFNNIVRRIDPVTLNVTTYAGTAKTLGNTDNVAATSARLIGPAGVAVDAGGNMLIVDFDFHRVKYIDATYAPTPAPTSPSLTRSAFTTQPSGNRVSSTTESLALEGTGARPNANFHRNIAIGVVVGVLGAMGIVSGFIFWRTRAARVRVTSTIPFYSICVSESAPPSYRIFRSTSNVLIF